MSEKIKTAVMEIIKAHMDGEDKNTKAVLSDVMESVRETLEQEPCEKQIKIGTKVRTTKDKDFACQEVFPVGTIGIVERIDKGGYLPYKIVANNDYWFYSRDMFEIIEDVEPCDKCVYSTKDGYCQYDDISETIPPLEPCDDTISRSDMFDAIGHGTTYTSEELQRIIQNLPPVNPQPLEHFIDGVHAMGYREGYKDAQKQKSGKWIDDGFYAEGHSHKAFTNGTPIPDNATNGDVIKALFADFMYVPWKEWLMIDLPWWNAPYQKGGKE